jgi:glycosyltransferase involved in cell wall biosynthesis
MSILVAFRFESNIGYAIERLERVFLAVARRLVGGDEHIHFSYPSLDGGAPNVLEGTQVRVLQFDQFSTDPDAHRRIEQYLLGHRIQIALGMDFQVKRPTYPALSRGGIKALAAYWGAPMSAENSGVRLLLKRLDVATTRHKPGLYIFESEAMRRTATHGRGIPASSTAVCRLSVDSTRFAPREAGWSYPRDLFGIPGDRAIVFYSGHMEERKGVAVIVKAMVELVVSRHRRDVHLLVLGNRPGEADRFDPLFAGTPAQHHVTFGGYRSDVADIMPGCSIGVIASTGWDSFPASSLEMASSGLPLIVSNLGGLPETIIPEETGLLFPPGDHLALADAIERLIDDPEERLAFGNRARARILSSFTPQQQIDGLVTALEGLCHRTGVPYGGARAEPD